MSARSPIPSVIDGITLDTLPAFVAERIERAGGYCLPPGQEPLPFEQVPLHIRQRMTERGFFALNIIRRLRFGMPIHDLEETYHRDVADQHTTEQEGLYARARTLAGYRATDAEKEGAL